MPTDDAWDDDAQKLEEVRKYFLEHPDEDCIPLFLNAFPNDDSSGFGVYQLIEDVIAAYPPGVVMPHILAALKSTSRNQRSWNAQIASRVPHPELVPALADLLEEDDFDLNFPSFSGRGVRVSWGS